MGDGNPISPKATVAAGKPLTDPKETDTDR